MNPSTHMNDDLWRNGNVGLVTVPAWYFVHTFTYVLWSGLVLAMYQQASYRL